MSDGHEEPATQWWKQRSYLGLISLLVVVVIFIGLLVFFGVGPLKQHEGAAPAGTPTTLPSGPPKAPTPADQNTASLPAPNTVITRIALGSCLDESGPMEILSAIEAQHPQLFIFEGDNVYADAADEKAVGGASNVATGPFMRCSGEPV